MAHPLTEALLAWYRHNARSLPWRGTRDPYAIWVSEVMLQQTRVEAVLPYYKRWMERFPTVEVLAGAALDEVLAVWEGLGYYSRARNLHRASRLIVEQHGGAVPATIEGLGRLPGIGRYTAAAIAAIAFDADTLALDGNLRRVLARLFDLDEDPRTPGGERRIRSQAVELLPPGRASVFNQALMDLGSLICTPRSPVCGRCPLPAGCLAFQRGVQEQRPIRPARRPVPHRAVAAAVLRRAGRILIGRRPQDKLLGGLWEFPGGKQEPGEGLKACLRRELREELGVGVLVGAPLGVFDHAYTHFSVRVHAFECTLAAGEPQPLEHSQLAWVKPSEMGASPMCKVDRQIADRIAAGLNPA